MELRCVRRNWRRSWGGQRKLPESNSAIPLLSWTREQPWSGAQGSSLFVEIVDRNCAPYVYTIIFLPLFAVIIFSANPHTSPIRVADSTYISGCIDRANYWTYVLRLFAWGRNFSVFSTVAFPTWDVLTRERLPLWPLSEKVLQTMFPYQGYFYLSSAVQVWYDNEYTEYMCFDVYFDETKTLEMWGRGGGKEGGGESSYYSFYSHNAARISESMCSMHSKTHTASDLF